MCKLPLLPLVLLACALLFGCKKPQASGTLLIAGASTMRNYVEPVVKAFTAENPSVHIVCEDGGSTAALVALKHGAIDIATITRPVTVAEDDAYLRDYLVARDGLAIIVNPTNPVSELSMIQLARIFEGRVTKWKEVGGHEGAIILVERDPKSNVRKSLEDLLVAGESFSATSTTAASSTDVLNAVRSAATAIGYVTLRKMGPGVKALRVNGVEMSKFTMLSGRYPLARSFYLAIHMTKSVLAERFIEFTLSKTGQDLLASQGLLEVF